MCIANHSFVIGALRGVLLSVSVTALAQSNDSKEAIAQQKKDVQADYVQGCSANSCAPFEAVNWSELPGNERAVAVAVRMGTLNQVPDYRIRTVLEEEFKTLGVNNVRFFFEENDVGNTGITLHVRGGTDGPYVLVNRIIAGLQQAANYTKIIGKDAIVRGAVSENTLFRIVAKFSY